MLIEHNLGEKGQVRRLRVGVVAFGAALALAVAHARLQAPRPLALGLFAPFFLSVWSIAEGLLGTSTLLAWRGLRDMGDGPEKIADIAQLARVRASARLAAALALALSAALTALMFLTT